MQVLKSISEVRSFRTKLNANPSKRLGFVPTMGFLHDGHLSLVRLAKKDCETVGVSIFVNPTQFGPNEDFAAYPRALERDLDLLRKENVDFVFCPSAEEMYPTGAKTWVEVEGMDKITREGASRQGHFRGVSTVVSKLFNIVQPHKAYFGQKDGIQCIVIKKFVKDLNVPVDVIIGDTLRESDGLAMSSRNVYLNEDQRKVAPILYKALSAAKEICLTNPSETVGNVVNRAKEIIGKESSIRLDYIVASDVGNGEDIPSERKVGELEEIMISGAIFNGKTRLIDNVLFKPTPL